MKYVKKKKIHEINSMSKRKYYTNLLNKKEKKKATSFAALLHY